MPLFFKPVEVLTPLIDEFDRSLGFIAVIGRRSRDYQYVGEIFDSDGRYELCAPIYRGSRWYGVELWYWHS